MASFARPLLLLFFIASLGACSSSDFAVAPSDPASDAGVDTSTTNDAPPGVDSAPPDPCAPVEGVAKFCVDVQLERKEHPSYDAASGAVGLGLDGNGVVFAYLYAKDPGLKSGSKGGASPVAVLQYPPPEKIGEEVNVDAGLPLTLSGQAPPGDYWVVTGFQDNKTKTRTAETPTLPGDFVIVPGVTPEGNALYPKMTLEAGKTARITSKLKPYRQVEVVVQASPKLGAKAKTTPSIHGDGPIMFVVYDGNISVEGKATILSADVRPCINVKPALLNPPEVVTSFGTTVDGEHNLFAALFDYSSGGTSSTDRFPGLGSLVTQTIPGAPTPVPRVNISSTSWTASTRAPLDETFYTNDGVDPFTCP